MGRHLEWALLLLASSACGNGASPQSAVSGRALLSGLSDHSGIFVFVSGRGVAEDSQVTDASGSWSFQEPGNFRVFVSAYAPSTRETELEGYVDLTGSNGATIPDFIFTPVGALTGSVTVSRGSPEGVTVALEGTDLVATTDAGGHFTMDGVVAGTYTLRASMSGQPAVSRPGVVVAYKQTTTVTSIAL